MSRIIQCIQQSDLWLAARVGRITGSRLGDLMATPTTRASTRKGVSMPAGSEAAAKEDYRRELVVERVYGRSVGCFQTKAMIEGSEREPFARILYEADTTTIVDQVGFALHPRWDWFGVSVDGLVNEDGGTEFKCPTEMVHDSYAANPEVLAEEYKWQCLGCMICFPLRDWWDLCSFSPYAPDEIKLVKFRFQRVDWLDTIAAIETEALVMHEGVESQIAQRGLPPTEFDIMPEKPRMVSKERAASEFGELGITDADLPNWYKEMAQ